MAVQLVNPVTVPVGSAVHLTPIDQNNNPIPIAQCTIIVQPGYSMPSGVLSISYDATGALLTGIAPGSANLMWRAVAPNGGTTEIFSAPFVAVVPWNVTEVGDTQP